MKKHKFTLSGCAGLAGIVTLALTLPAFAQRPYFLLPGVHPGYSLVSMRPASMETSGANAAPNVGGMAWLPDGRLFIASMSSNSPGGPNANRLGVSHGYMFSGIPGATSNANVSVTQVATGFQMPSGAVAIGDTLYVLDNEDGLTKLTPNGSGGYVKSVLHKGVLGYVTTKTGLGYRTWTGGLAYRDGYFYAAVGMALNSGPSVMDTSVIYRGKGVIYKISKNGASVDTLAGGVRNAVSLAFGPDDQLFYTDNQGSFMPSSGMFHVKQGAFFGHPLSPFENSLRTPPAVIFAHGSGQGGGDANNPVVARVATDMLTLRNGQYKNQILVGTNHSTGMNRVFLEKIPDGNGGHVYQGAVFPFSQGFGVGSATGSGNFPTAALPGVLPDFRTNVNRLSYGPDGHIYLGGGNSPGGNTNGGHGFEGSLQYGLARLVANNDTVFEMKAIRSLGPTQLEIEFTEPITNLTTTDVSVRQGISTQATNNNYGAGYSPPSTALTVTAVALNAEKTRATLTITGLQQRPATTTPGSVQDRTWGSLIQVRITNVTAVSNRPMWGDTTAAKRGLVGWYTLNKFGPGSDAGGITAVARGDKVRGMNTGLMFTMRAGAVAVRSPVEQAYTLRTLDMAGRVIATHAVEAGRQEYLVPRSSLTQGLTVIEARAADGRRFSAAVSGI